MTLTVEHSYESSFGRELPFPPRLHNPVRQAELHKKAKRAFDRHAGRAAARYMDEAMLYSERGRTGLVAVEFRIRCHHLAANQTWEALQRDRTPLEKKMKLADELKGHIRRSKAFGPSNRGLNFQPGDFGRLYNQLRAMRMQ